MFLNMSVDFQRTTWLYIPGDRTLPNHRCENLKSDFSVQFIYDRWNHKN
jgi:hypothetical protein